jgi:hypothetical protein
MQVRKVLYHERAGSSALCNFSFAAISIVTGCRDYAPYLGISSALKMWQSLGAERCRAYMHRLLRDAVELLTAAWGTGPLVPMEMCANSMACVGLPVELAATQPATSADAKHIQVRGSQYAVLVSAMLHIRNSQR